MGGRSEVKGCEGKGQRGKFEVKGRGEVRSEGIGREGKCIIE